MFNERVKTHHSAMSEGKKYLAGMSEVKTALNVKNTDDSKNAVIYIHVPFCHKICSFCNMRRNLQSPIKNYADLIIEEIHQYADFPYIQTTTFDAVYFGGGTPTTLSADSLCAILKALKQNLNFTKDAEFTIETTVTELDENKQKALAEAGVNRFSVGIQTFDDEGRRLMGRIGSGDNAFNRLRQLKAFENVTVSMDLIYNYPNQTMQSLNEDLDKILELDLDGFSMYSLINMRGTSIEQAQSEKTDEEMFFAIVNKMKRKGYHFLELTKMVKTDRYKYIMNRHQAADTLPLGAGAGGSVNNLAMMNPIKLDEYEQSVKDTASKKGMLFLPEYKEITKFKGAIQTIHLPENETLYKDINMYKDFLKHLLEEDMIRDTGTGVYQLTDRGIFWGNTISRELSKLIE